MRNSFSMVSDPGEFCTPPGDPIHHICTGRFNGKTLSVVETGTEDIQQSIQAHAPFTDLRYMLSRLSVGDNSVLSSCQPIYGDFSGLFDNPVDAINAVNDARSRFDLLSAEDKKEDHLQQKAYYQRKSYEAKKQTKHANHYYKPSFLRRKVSQIEI